MVSLQQSLHAADRRSTLRPDFLIISPPKTGSTWLASNLRHHPQLFIPDIKEIKYFSSLMEWFDLDWYLEHFRPGAGRLKGEASPSYAILPLERIRLIRQLMPDVKLIFLMREPIARAWSHAKHNRNYREANFADISSDSGPASEEQWQANFTHDWPLTSGDYLGQLRRWLSVFPAEQMFVGFQETIAGDPAPLLRQILAFLGVDAELDLSAFPLRERFLEGSKEELSVSHKGILHRLWHRRSVALAAFLRAHFALQCPVEWQAILTPADGDCSQPDFDRADDDRYLATVARQEAAFPLFCRDVLDDYQGYQIYFHRGELIALARSLGVGPTSLDEAERRCLEERGDCFRGETIADVKDRINLHLSEKTRTRIQALETDLSATHRQLAILEKTIDDYRAALRLVESKAFGVSSPREFALLLTLRALVRRTLGAWQRLAAFIG